MTEATMRSTIKALLRTAAASIFSLSFFLSVPASPVRAGEALNDLNRIAPQAEAPIVPAVPAAVLPSEPLTPLASGRKMKVYFLNVGQGDAEYIELPNGKNVLIDGGPSKSSTSLLAQFMSWQNVTRIDYVVLTHPHSDHYKGLNWVFNNFSVGRFYDTKMDNTGSKTDNQLRDQVAVRNISVSYPSQGDALDWDPSVQVKVLNSCPAPVQSDDGNNVNNCSIVLKLSYQGSSVLLTGDAEAGVESAMVARFGTELKSDILKVAHHGSDTASSAPFLAAVKPGAAYISVGKNSYGLPTTVVTDRLKAAGIKVRRTDEVGTQEVVLGARTPDAQELAALYQVPAGF